MYGSFGGGGEHDVIRNDVYSRLMENGSEEATGNPDLRELLEAHFNRLPQSYGLDVNLDRVADVLLHKKLLARAKDPTNRPVFHILFLENICTTGNDDDDDDEQVSSIPHASILRGAVDDEDDHAQLLNHRNYLGDFETCSMLEDLNLDVTKNSNGISRENLAEDFTRWKEALHTLIHEVIFSTVDKPKLLSQLSALLSGIGLNIPEAHVFSATDGDSLGVFVVDGWPVEDTESLHKAMIKSIARSEGSWSQSMVEKPIAAKTKYEDWEIDWRLLKIGEKIAAGSCGDLFNSVYYGQNVAVKVLRSEHLNKFSGDSLHRKLPF